MKDENHERERERNEEPIENGREERRKNKNKKELAIVWHILYDNTSHREVMTLK